MDHSLVRLLQKRPLTCSVTQHWCLLAMREKKALDWEKKIRLCNYDLPLHISHYPFAHHHLAKEWQWSVNKYQESPQADQEMWQKWNVLGIPKRNRVELAFVIIIHNQNSLKLDSIYWCFGRGIRVEALDELILYESTDTVKVSMVISVQKLPVGSCLFL